MGCSMNLENISLNQDSKIQPQDWAELGGKVQGLLWLQKIGARVPRFWVFKSNSIKQEIIKEIVGFESLATQLKQTSLLSIRPKIVSWIVSQLKDLPAGSFAVRSSGAFEDSATHSFAGIYESYLQLTEKMEIAERIFDVFASGYSERAQHYFIMRTIEKSPDGLTVIIQQMVPAKMSGVSFSQNIRSGRSDESWVSATYGLGEDLVSGATEGIEFQIDSKGRISSEGNRKITSGTDLNIIRTVGSVTRDLADFYGKPVDIEWAFDGVDVWIVQIRPITNQSNINETTKLVFDNSNIQESYCGVSTPLTYSYASEAYKKVYSKLMEFLGADADDMRSQTLNLENMLGFVSGRVYYNINSWYATLTLLPAFRKRKEDMEAMMGLENPVDFVTDHKPLSGLALIKHSFKMTALILRLLRLQSRIDTVANEFDSWFWNLYSEARAIPLKDKSAHELVVLTKHYQDRFLEKWAIPVLNDTLVMMNMGQLQRILKKYNLGDSVKSLIYGQEIESIRPTLNLQELASEIVENSDLAETILKCTSRELPFLISTFFPDFKLKVERFIALYGDRTMGELKLETITFRQDESLFYDLLKNFVIAAKNGHGSKAVHDVDHIKKVFTEVESKMNLFQRYLFRKVVKKTVNTVAHREKMRLHRTRNYGLMRDFYLAIGEKWAQNQILEQPRDIFYITLSEIYEMNYGRNVTRSYKKLVELRKMEATEYKKENPLNQCHLGLPVGAGIGSQSQDNQVEMHDTSSENSWHGLACSQGVVEGEVVLVEDPSDIRNIQGKILVALRTDPGWTPLFALIKGVVIERGSLLSHSAVISREMGIPAVVNISQITKKLKTGERIRVDGNSGQITRL